MNKSKVIGIILAYKNAQYLENLYKNLPKGILDDIFITNDESGDGIEIIAEKLGIKCFSHSRLGYGGNTKYGLKKAMKMGADYMAIIHGDGQFNPKFIIPGMEKIKEGSDLVLGTRFTNMRQPLRDGMPMIKYIANICLSFIQKHILGIRVSEFHTGARIYSRKALEKINISKTSDNFLWDFEIIALFAYNYFKIDEVPARCYYNKDHSSISIKNSAIYAIKTFGVLFKYIFARLGFKTKLFHK